MCVTWEGDVVNVSCDTSFTRAHAVQTMLNTTEKPREGAV